jgi:hypothetical protein
LKGELEVKIEHGLKYTLKFVLWVCESEF